MAEIVIENAVKRFGKFEALKDVSLTIQDQEFMVLLGPSGCGKTTLLRAIAGLGMLDEGRILIDGRDVTYMAPRERHLAMVFQSYAIFPHMTVYDNIGFGLKMRGTDKQEINRRVQHAAEMVHIEHMLDRYPAHMSGGQRQRVAVARAIAVQAEVLLMDEPLSNLDALLRLEMRAELKQLLAELKVTTIYVTHDQIEAMSMGDRIAVMRDGVIQQIDQPSVIYDTPANQFIGGFIGNPPMNFLTGRVLNGDGSLQVEIGDFHISPPDAMTASLTPYVNKSITVGIRAESIETFNEPIADGMKVEVQVVEPLGSQNLLTTRIADSTLKVATHPDFLVNAGEPIWMRFPSSKVRWIDRDTQMAI